MARHTRTNRSLQHAKGPLAGLRQGRSSHVALLPQAIVTQPVERLACTKAHAIVYKIVPPVAWISRMRLHHCRV
jgi:hypothetical protein